MVVDATPAEAERRGAFKELLKVCGAAGGTSEDQLAIEDLREELVEIHSRRFPTPTEHVRASDPADVIDEVVVGLRLELVGGGTWSQLEARTVQREFVD